MTEDNVMRRAILILMLVSTFGAINGCLNDVEEVPLDYSGVEIPAPEGLMARVADGTVELEWIAVATAARYRVYRTTIYSEKPTRVAETQDTTYTDTDLVNGRAYYYSVSTVTAENIEGPRSDAIVAVPSVHSVIINGGLQYTNSRDVTLSLTAPPTTALMMIGRESDLSDGTWETFAATRSWRLNEGDGTKYVYARFQDGSGGISPVVSDSITLDTYAEIDYLDMALEDDPLPPGGSAYFAMHAVGNESGGEAAVTIEGTSLQIILEDKGYGAYEKVYTFPSSVRGTDLIVNGHFKDQAGNVADPFELEETLSFTDPPDSVYLYPATDSTVSSISLLWDTYDGDHFQSYKLYRDTMSGVDSTKRLVTTMYSVNQSTYTDNGLIENETYYYRIYVVNDLDEMKGSNEREASTYDAIPTAVVLDPPSSIGENRLTLTWSRNNDTDFLYYRVYFDTLSVVSLDSEALQPYITLQDSNFIDHTGIDTTAHTYYYRVYVFDNGLKSRGSNEVNTAGE